MFHPSHPLHPSLAQSRTDTRGIASLCFSPFCLSLSLLFCFSSRLLFSSSATEKQRECETVLDWRFCRTPPLAGVPCARRIERRGRTPARAEKPDNRAVSTKTANSRAHHSKVLSVGKGIASLAAIPSRPVETAPHTGSRSRGVRLSLVPGLRNDGATRRERTRPRDFSSYFSPPAYLSLLPPLHSHPFSLSRPLARFGARTGYGSARVLARGAGRYTGGTERRRG